MLISFYHYCKIFLLMDNGFLPNFLKKKKKRLKIVFECEIYLIRKGEFVMVKK